MQYTKEQIEKTLIEMKKNGLITGELAPGGIVKITPKGKRKLKKHYIKQKIKNFFFPRSEREN